MTTQDASVIITGISGYTRYLARVEIDHAQYIPADLMGSVAGAMLRERFARPEPDEARAATPTVASPPPSAEHRG